MQDTDNYVHAPRSFFHLYPSLCTSTFFKISIPDITMARVWLITGRSSGFGRQIAIAVAHIGDTVVATSRDPSKLTDLQELGNIIPRQLDIPAGN